MSAENSKRGTPPYISPRTFRHLIEQFQKNLPDRIDRSYLDELHSGSTSTQIMSAFRYLNLADPLNKPTHHLKLLIAAEGEERAKRLKDIANSAYSFVLSNGSVDLQTATYAQLEELFHDYSGVDGDVRRKCIKFFTALSQDADIPLSPHITSKVRMDRGIKTTRLPVRKTSSRNVKEAEVPQQTIKVPELLPWHQMLVEKFPHFDPAWNDEIKKKWFEAYFELFKINPHK